MPAYRPRYSYPQAPSKHSYGPLSPLIFRLQSVYVSPPSPTNSLLTRSNFQQLLSLNSNYQNLLSRSNLNTSLTMKFTTLLLLAAVASVMVEATPLATPQDTCRISCRREMCQAIKECREHCPADCPLKAEEAAPVEPKVEARDDCKKCDDFYNKCRGVS